MRCASSRTSVMQLRAGIFYVILGCCVLILSVSFYQVKYSSKHLYHSGLTSHIRYFQAQDGFKDAFLVDTPMCKIPNLNPYDESIVNYLWDGKNISCNERIGFLYQKDNRIFINHTAAGRATKVDRIEYCKYQPIWRPVNATDHNYFKYLDPSDKFENYVTITDDFVRVLCYNGTDFKVYADYFAFVHKSEHIEQDCNVKFSKYKQETNIDKPLNALMIGIDSISRLNFMRYMPKTREYLLKTMGAVEIFGYNKVADNTFVNIVPLSVGKFVDELPWNESMRNIPFDKHEFVWKQFSDKGYRTLYVEDAPRISIFDFGKAGFRHAPAHYFNRAFSLAMEKDPTVWNRGHHCVNDRLETNIYLEYVKKFLTVFKSSPYFAFSFLTRLTHYALAETHYAETPYLDLLTYLNNGRLLDNTVLIFYSDHGLRFGSVREKYIGKLEERLPLMYIKLPDAFIAKNEDMYQNLLTNARRLTTPFDIYETLVDVLYLKSNLRPNRTNNRGYSLLDNIPENRSCEDAGVLPHWCTCAQHKTVLLNDSIVLDVSSTLVEHINIKLENYMKLCEEVSLNNTKHVEKIVPQDKLLRFRESKNDVINRTVMYGERVDTYIDYQVTLSTVPGNAIFEGTVRHNEKEKIFEVIGDVSRINMYGNQSHCINVHELKKFCYCKEQQLPPSPSSQ